MLRFTLYNEALGSVIIEKKDPIGINDIKQTIKRSKDFVGMTYDIVLDVEFIGGGRRFIKKCFDTQGGIDAQCKVTVYEWLADQWQFYYEGRINFNKYELTEQSVTVNIEQVGFQRDIQNLFDQEVILTDKVDVSLHPKKILQQYEAKPTDPLFSGIGWNVSMNGDGSGSNVHRSVAAVLLFDTTNQIKSDVESSFPVSWGFINLGDSVGQFNQVYSTVSQYKTWLTKNVKDQVFFNNIQADYDSTATVTLLYNLSFNCSLDKKSDDQNLVFEVLLWAHITDSAQNTKYLETIGKLAVTFGDVGATRTYQASANPISYSFNYDFKKGDQFITYATFHYRGYFDPDAGSERKIEPTINVNGNNTLIKVDSYTTFPTSTAKAVTLESAFRQCARKYTGVTYDPLKSSLLTGKLSPIVWTNGNNIRKLEKDIFVSIKTLFKFINSILPCGIGFEKDTNGNQIMVVEEITYFYNTSLNILSIGKVYNIKQKLLNSKYYNQIEIGGTEKIDLPQKNGVDSFSQIRRFAIPVKNTSNKLVVSDRTLIDGFAIEFQRRLIGKTENGKFDDKDFAIVTIKTGTAYAAKKNEGYSLITGVIDPSSGYNYDISPARNLLNYRQLIASQLIRSASKTLKMTFAEGNFEMATQKTAEGLLVEKADMDLSSVAPIYDTINYSFEAPLSSAQWQTIKASQFGYMEFEDKNGVLYQGFISETGIEHDPNRGLASFDLLKAFPTYGYGNYYGATEQIGTL
jgi:hypothetical protein